VNRILVSSQTTMSPSPENDIDKASPPPDLRRIVTGHNEEGKAVISTDGPMESKVNNLLSDILDYSDF